MLQALKEIYTEHEKSISKKYLLNDEEKYYQIAERYQDLPDIDGNNIKRLHLKTSYLTAFTRISTNLPGAKRIRRSAITRA